VHALLATTDLGWFVPAFVRNPVSYMVAAFVMRIVFFVSGCVNLHHAGWNITSVLVGYFIASFLYTTIKLWSVSQDARGA
jgi:hypothetical protein